MHKALGIVGMIAGVWVAGFLFKPAARPAVVTKINPPALSPQRTPHESPGFRPRVPVDLATPGLATPRFTDLSAPIPNIVEKVEGALPSAGRSVGADSEPANGPVEAAEQLRALQQRLGHDTGALER